MTNRPLLLDLFCCAGGASRGYADAGFEVIGVDIAPQPHYPFDFFQADALEFLGDLVTKRRRNLPDGTSFRLRDFAAFHGSPPCQSFTQMSLCRPGLQATYPNLIPQTRELFKATGKPYAIENVVGAPLDATVELCGTQFGKRIRLHRLFETNFPVSQPACDHSGYILNPNNYAGRARIRAEFGQDCNITEVWRNEKGVPWMNYHEASEAIMPAYTRHVGRYLHRELARREDIKTGEAA